MTDRFGFYVTSIFVCVGTIGLLYLVSLVLK